MSASTIGERVANAIVSYVAYLGKTVWPAGLSIVYPFRTHVATLSVVGCIALLAALTAVAIIYRRRFPFLLVGWLCTRHVGAGHRIVHVGHEAMADRYTYIPLIGIFVAIAC